MYNLFIDDERDPIDVKWGSVWERYMYMNYDWIIARNWYEVLEIIISYGIPSIISFDHDLGDNTPTGYDIAKNISNLIMDGGHKIPDKFQYLVHSKNPIGKTNIESYMNNFLKNMKGE